MEKEKEMGEGEKGEERYILTENEKQKEKERLEMRESLRKAERKMKERNLATQTHQENLQQ